MSQDQTPISRRCDSAPGGREDPLITHDPAGNPAVVYRESRSPGSDWAVRRSLESIAEILGGEGADPWSFPSEDRRHQHTARTRRQLLDRHAPSTVNKMVSTLRGVLTNAWRLGLMDTESYRPAIAVENAPVKQQPTGRAVSRG